MPKPESIVKQGGLRKLAENIHSFTNNPDLPSMTLPFEWKGTPLDKRGRFVNHEHAFVDSFKEVLRWQFMKNPQKKEKKSSVWRLTVDNKKDFLTKKEDCIVWLGHASFFIRLSGVSILIDPVLFDVSLIKRKSALPVAVEELVDVDYILISHDHRDHLDVKSLKHLSMNNSCATYLTGLKLDGLLKKITKSDQVQAAGWFQQYKIAGDLNITYVPSRHWGRRFVRDTNRRLWGGFVIQGAGKTIYFGGDSGYGSHFSDIGMVFPQIDYAMIGIGAYKPEFFMAQSHCSPIDAIQGFKDSMAKIMIPMHYGTFDLSDEPLGDPQSRLINAGMEQDIMEQINCLNVGETLFI